MFFLNQVSLLVFLIIFEFQPYEMMYRLMLIFCQKIRSSKSDCILY